MQPPYVLFSCRKCHALLIFVMARKTRTCTQCSHVNRRELVVPIKGFESAEQATNALRYLKIPPEARGTVPYLAGSTNDEKITSREAIKAFFRVIRAGHPGGIDRATLSALASARGIDQAILDKHVAIGMGEGTIITVPGQRLKFV